MRLQVKVRIPLNLQRLTGENVLVSAEGRTVAECIEDLEARFPGFRDGICDAEGQIRDFYEIFVNGKSAYPEELTAPLRDGDELFIALLVAGG